MKNEVTLNQLGFFAIVKKSWHVVRSKYWSLAKIFGATFILLFAVRYIPYLLFSSIKDQQILTQILIATMLLEWVIELLISIGWIHILMQVLDGKDVDVSDLFVRKDRFFFYLISAFLFGLLVFVGFILVIIPGIYWALRYAFVPYLVIDRNAGIKEAFHLSSTLTKGSKGTMAWYGAGFLLLNIVGLLALGFGLLVTLPITWIANGMIYRHLLLRLPKAN